MVLFALLLLIHPQFNSETDFVARNAQFQDTARAIAAATLFLLPARVAALSEGTGFRAASEPELVALSQSPLPDLVLRQHTATGSGLAAPPAGTTVSSVVTNLIAVIRENMVLRRLVLHDVLLLIT